MSYVILVYSHIVLHLATIAVCLSFLANGFISDFFLTLQFPGGLFHKLDHHFRVLMQPPVVRRQTSGNQLQQRLFLSYRCYINPLSVLTEQIHVFQLNLHNLMYPTDKRSLIFNDLYT